MSVQRAILGLLLFSSGIITALIAGAIPVSVPAPASTPAPVPAPASTPAPVPLPLSVKRVTWVVMTASTTWIQRDISWYWVPGGPARELQKLVGGEEWRLPSSSGEWPEVSLDTEVELRKIVRQEIAGQETPGRKAVMIFTGY